MKTWTNVNQDSHVRGPRAQRRGYIYIMVLGVTAILSIISMVMLTSSRLGSKTIEATHSYQHAQVLAAAGVEHAIASINSNVNWRDPAMGYVIDTEYPATPAAAGLGTFTWKLSDTDGALNDNPADQVAITAYGRVNGYTFTQEVVASPSGSGLDSLEVCVATFNTHNLSGGTLLADNAITSTKFCNAWGGMQVYADVEATSGTSGGTFHQSTSTPVARNLPDQNAVFDYYTSRGTLINLTSLPYVGGYYEINNAVLSPDVNPWGGTNGEGIYIIDCDIAGLTYPVRIRNSRIIGTLVVLDSDGFRVEGAVNWSAAIPNFPALLADGDILISHDSTVLLEESAQFTNFNPPGAPFYGGTDGDQNDVCPSLMTGVIYAKGDILLSSNPRIHGVLVGNSKFEMFSGSADLIYNSIYLSAPPPGFDAGTGTEIKLVVGSWKRGLSP